MAEISRNNGTGVPPERSQAGERARRVPQPLPHEEERAHDAVKVVSVWYWVGPIAVIAILVVFAIWLLASR